MKPTHDAAQSSEDLLQERIERLEAGASLDVCQQDLTPVQAELLSLVSLLRAAPSPEQDPAVSRVQRVAFLDQVDRQHTRGSSIGWDALREAARSMWNRLRPRTAFAGAMAAVVVGAFIILLALAMLWLPSDDPVSAPHGAPSQVASSQHSEPTQPGGAPSVRPPKSEPTAQALIVDIPSPEPTSEPRHELFVPILSMASPPDPSRATLQQIRGRVQIQDANGAWRTADLGTIVRAAQRLRTGALSSAVIAFYDGSQARLGPNTEVSIGELDARLEGGPRTIMLAQWAGEMEHVVAPVNGGASHYEVQTPFGSGVAKGTVFRVRVASNQAAYFGVDEGVVAVTGKEVTVNVIAGQSTAIQNGEPPAEPVFSITGEGEVTQTEPTWVIAGQSFLTHEDTVIVGDPQIGDWVRVQGHLSPEGEPVADLIELIERPPVNRFTITGPVETIGATEWVVAGQTITVDAETDIDEEIEEGDLVKVEGEILEGVGLLARRIVLLQDVPGLPFQFTGVVQTAGDGLWEISGIAITVDEDTDVDPEAGQGSVVEVRGWILDDGTWLAREIKLAEPLPATFQFVGLVGSIEPWEVAGIAFETDGSTEIEPGIKIDDLVEVKGQILPNGTWLATEIALVDESDDDRFTIVFVGIVDAIDDWVVSGIPLKVNDETAIEDGIEEGDLVKVTVDILPDGAWLATKIERFGSNDDVLGCVLIAAVVETIGDNWLGVSDWPPINLKDTIVKGQITVGSVILMQVCVSEDGSIVIAMITVVYQPEPDVPPPPPPPPPHNDGSEKVNICHIPSGNPIAAHNITIDRSALPAHLSHGDYVGQCQPPPQPESQKKTVVICHRHQGESGGSETMTIEWSAWNNEHSRHGDTLGPCN